MDVVNVFLLYVTASAVALQMAAGGWVKVREYFKAKAESKVAALKAAADAKQAEIDAAVAAALAAVPAPAAE